MASASSPPPKKQEKKDLGWMEWFKGWYDLIFEACFQKIMSRHLHNPLPLPPLDGKTCIVTGSTSGIGLEMARQLEESGAHVIMAVRNPIAANELIQKWQNRRTDSAPLNIDVMELDLLSLESVTRFSELWNSSGKPLNVLINNAGIFSIGEPQKFSRDGYERHMQVNHLAPALLSLLLLPSLKRGAPSRIINVNSVMHAIGFVDTSDMNFTSGNRKLTSLKAYSSSKLAQLMFCRKVCLLMLLLKDREAQFLQLLILKSWKPKSEEWPVCAYISYKCRPMNPSKEAHNVNTSHIVWEKTLDMVGLPSNIVEMSLQWKRFDNGLLSVDEMMLFYLDLDLKYYVTISVEAA
ncbi:hypothetical protein RJ639_047153 [Escallonia herrerae]|uniref:Uncharacterized protein n=1 Tax=Escallonia herrerae TaxID=1293975 RepID=A0AA88W8I9_9ASTE|nr:hypothetical protein RJ639_047153 [Escallonia herrerae]